METFKLRNSSLFSAFQPCLGVGKTRLEVGLLESLLDISLKVLQLRNIPVFSVLQPLGYRKDTV